MDDRIRRDELPALRSFTSLEDLQGQHDAWATDVAYRRHVRRLGGTVADRYAAERGFLATLPEPRPDTDLTPLAGRFRAGPVLPGASHAGRIEADMPEPIRAILAGAPTYPEGRCIRLEVPSDDDVASVILLAQIRMADR